MWVTLRNNNAKHLFPFFSSDMLRQVLQQGDGGAFEATSPARFPQSDSSS